MSSSDQAAELRAGSVVVVGTGTLLGSDITQRFKSELNAATIIFSIVEEDVESWLPRSLRNKPFHSLRHLYHNKESRIDNYQRVAGTVVHAGRSGQRAAFVTYGSPLVFDRVTCLIRDLCVAENIPCTVVPAVSSIDTVIAVLGVDIAPGLQICEARWLVNHSIQLDPKLPAFLFQIGQFWTDGIPDIASASPSKLTELRIYLEQFYPSDHYGIFVKAPGTRMDSGYQHPVKIRMLDSGLVSDVAGTSFYIPSIIETPGATQYWHHPRDEAYMSDFGLEWK